jgi:serine/threonine protein kinase
LNNILYNPFQFEELIKNCNIPKFDTNDYIYKNSIGEGSFGTIFEVEEKNTGKKYAIKKIISIDIQELIKQMKQLELEFSIKNDNIIKIYKIEIKCLDFSTYSINVLMELAISDWNQEILNRAIKKDYYKEEELINITNQIINIIKTNIFLNI